MVSIDSWKYPTDLLVLQPKNKFNGYPFILALLMPTLVVGMGT